VNQLPYMKKWVEALNRLEFMIVQEQFMTATARFADIIFPVATILEKNDVIASGATPYYGYLKKIIEPVGETKSQRSQRDPRSATTPDTARTRIRGVSRRRRSSAAP